MQHMLDLVYIVAVTHRPGQVTGFTAARRSGVHMGYSGLRGMPKTGAANRDRMPVG